MGRFKYTDITEAVDLIKEFEGLFLKAYKDPVGIWTIGWGSIRHPNGVAVKSGDVITKELAESYLRHEVEKFMSDVEKLVTFPINVNQFGALVSFTYNLGADIDADTIAEGLGDSTLLKYLNLGKVQEAADEFLKWVNAGGKKLNGLVRRRGVERALFLKPGLMPSEPIPVDQPQTPPVIATPSKPSDVDEIETPEWFEPYKATIVKLIEAVFGKKPPETAATPDHGETGAPAKTSTVSEGTGPRITMERVKEILLANGCDVTKPCMLAIRGYYADTYGAKGVNDRGVYDDAIIRWEVDTFRTYRANVDPVGVKKGHGFKDGTKGRASLKLGVWKYQSGMHNGSAPHLAYIQAAEVTVIRDGTNGDYPNTGWFGINIHRGGTNTPSSIGCQTIQPSEWSGFKTGFDAALKRHEIKVFQYCLVDEMNLRVQVLKT